MGSWGNGMLQSQLEFRLIGDYEEKFGLRELRVKLNEKAGFIFNANGSQGIRLAICADDCYGINAVEITQKYLDSGPLEEELGTFMTGRCWTGEDAQNFLVLTASAMTLGCSLSETVMKELQMMLKPQYQVLTAERGVPAFRTTFARSQMKKAVRDYKNGTPYDFGNTTMLENMLGHAAKTTTQNVGKMKIVETTMPNGMVIPQIVGIPSHEELGLKPTYPNDVCAACGTDNGADLLQCAKCKDRRYCSKACQKKHWKLHKPICSRPKEDLEKFMASVSLDFAKGT